MGIYPERLEGFEWRVVWFPPDRPQAVFHGTEEQVRRRAEVEAEWNPLVERRHYVLEPWEDGNG